MSVSYIASCISNIRNSMISLKLLVRNTSKFVKLVSKYYDEISVITMI